MADTDYPLLIFPDPAPAERAKRTGVGGNPKVPDASRQARRLAPQFWRLQEALERKRLALQENALGLLPEQVLVIDTVGLDAELSMCFLTSHEWRNRQAQKDYDA